MESKRIESQPNFPLTTALREIVDHLIADDWARWATADGSRFYYVVGMQAHMAEEQGGPDHLSLAVGSGRPVSLVGEQQVHAQLASQRPGEYYLRQVRSRLEASGITPAQVDRFLASLDTDEPAVEGWRPAEPGTNRHLAFIDLFRALAIRGGVPPETIGDEAERKRELDAAFQKVHLDQLATMFQSIVKRAGALEPLTFADPLLNEASRCYVHGFFRGAVLLSATALEKCLKTALGLTDEDYLERYRILVDQARDAGALGPWEGIGAEPFHATQAREVFEQRRFVAHQGQEPSSALAADLLTKARQVVEFVRTASKRR